MHICPQTARSAVSGASGIQELRITLKKPHPILLLFKKVTFAAVFMTLYLHIYYEKTHL